MRDVRIYTDTELRAGATVELKGGAARHVNQVLRMGPGEPLILFNGHGGEFAGVILAGDRHNVQVELQEHRDDDRMPDLQVALLHGLCRSERMDNVIQKATELGVAEIQPMLTERSRVKLDAKRGAKKQEHWRGVAVAACEQSGRNRLPLIHAPRPFKEIVANLSNYDDALVLDPNATQGLGDALKKADRIALLTGPESGFSDAEISAAKDAGARAVHLGPRVLRTETAPLAALTLVQHRVGDLGKRS